MGRLACCSNHPDHSVELSCDNSMTSQATEDGWMIPDLSEFRGDLSKMLVATAAAIAIGTIDGGRYRKKSILTETNTENYGI